MLVELKKKLVLTDKVQKLDIIDRYQRLRHYDKNQTLKYGAKSEKYLTQIPWPLIYQKFLKTILKWLCYCFDYNR